MKMSMAALTGGQGDGQELDQHPEDPDRGAKERASKQNLYKV
jgi:hypothetical protein